MATAADIIIQTSSKLSRRAVLGGAVASIAAAGAVFEPTPASGEQASSSLAALFWGYATTLDRQIEQAEAAIEARDEGTASACLSAVINLTAALAVLPATDFAGLERKRAALDVALHVREGGKIVRTVSPSFDFALARSIGEDARRLRHPEAAAITADMAKRERAERRWRKRIGQHIPYVVTPALAAENTHLG